MPALIINLQRALDCLEEWCRQNGMILNTQKTKVMLLATRQKRLHIDENIFVLNYNDIDLQITTGDKILGVNIDQNLQWNDHFQMVRKNIIIHMVVVKDIFVLEF